MAKHWQDLPPLRGYDKAYPETTVGASRFDLVLHGRNPEKIAFLEAKCVTLVQEGTGLFPDAPTERGRKHLLELARLARDRNRALVFYFMQHPRGKRAWANGEMDPKFADAMREAI